MSIHNIGIQDTTSDRVIESDTKRPFSCVCVCLSVCVCVCVSFRFIMSCGHVWGVVGFARE